jgi:hypothetical protein
MPSSKASRSNNFADYVNLKQNWWLAPSLRSGAATDFEIAGGGDYAFFEGQSFKQFC